MKITGSSIKFYIFTISMCIFFIFPTMTGNAESRISGENRYETAVQISKEGWGESRTVILVQGNNFPDALAGAPLAYKYDAPILLTAPNRLVGVTEQEIRRLKAKEVIILGGTVAVSEAVEQKLVNDLNLNVKRIAGKNRYETAELIASEIGTYSKAILANGRNFPDALSIAPFAAKHGYPILLTNSSDLLSETKKMLKQADEIIIVGGPMAVNHTIQQKLNAKRISGENRYETAANIVKTFDKSQGNIYVTTGRNFPDALSGAVLAANNSGSIILTQANTLPQSIEALLREIPIKNINIIGGAIAVEDSVIETINNIPTYKKKENDSGTVIYYAPHPDDEVLTMGVGIANDLHYGYDVHVVLLSEGRSSRVYANLAKTFPDLTREEFGKSRIVEFHDAMERMGIPEENLHIYDLPDGGFPIEDAKEVVLEMENQLPGAFHKAFSYYDSHIDHVTSGQAVNELYHEGEISNAEFYISIYEYHQTEGVHLPVYNRELVIDGLLAYKVFNPEQHRYAIGYTSVPRWFDHILARPRSKVHEPSPFDLELRSQSTRWIYKAEEIINH
ncbi:MAG: cell wall-binding repeat-containing protein [Bacillaceae bacterium]|nr:cell wall-binding repeat-containing protein [Bacillaceae bacterium]